MKLDDGIDKEDVEEAKASARSYGRYGALGIQMVVIILVLAWGGHWLDGRLALKTPWFALAGTLIGIFGALWTLLKETRKGTR